METTHHQPDTLRGVIQLSRWKEQAPLISLTLLGGLIAHSLHNTELDWRLLAVALANFLTVSFAFMINDIEDAPDDARNPISARRNPVTNGTLDPRTAWAACGVVVALALGLYTLGGPIVLAIGLLSLSLSFLYSWRGVRLKSSTIGLDIVSHTLMLGGLLPLAGYFAFSDEVTPAILLMAAAATLGSTYGQLYNQVRDYESDSAAGIVNVTIRLGKRAAYGLMYLAVVLAAIAGLLAASELRFPDWAPLAIIVSLIVGGLASAINHTDASGKPPLDFSGRLQVGFWVAFNLLMGLWVIWAMGLL